MSQSIYWPEAFGENIDFVGYNRAVKQLQKALGDIISNQLHMTNTKARLYCNIPFHHDPKSLKVTGYNEYMYKDRKIPLIAYTMFESTQMPKAWVKFLNKHVDAIIVPTQYCSDVFRMSGVVKPIKIACLGVDRDKFQYMPPVDHDGFNFLWQGHCYDPNGRKGAKVVEQAFKELKANGSFGDDVRLYLKYRPHENFKFLVDNLEVEPGIFHISDTLSEAAMKELLSKVDCCVNPSRGEGFGYIPLEQMAMGKPVILTNYSYPYTDPDYCIPLDYELKPSPTIWCYKHFAINGLGIEFNFGKGRKVYQYPKRMQRVSNGCYEFGINGQSEYVNKSIKGTLWNLLASLHAKSGLYRDLSRKWRYELKFESTGYDAEASVADLKEKMLSVYKNIEQWRERGPVISEYALNTWGLDRVKREFVKAIDELTEEGVI